MLLAFYFSLKIKIISKIIIVIIFSLLTILIINSNKIIKKILWPIYSPIYSIEKF